MATANCTASTNSTLVIRQSTQQLCNVGCLSPTKQEASYALGQAHCTTLITVSRESLSTPYKGFPSMGGNDFLRKLCRNKIFTNKRLSIGRLASKRSKRVSTTESLKKIFQVCFKQSARLLTKPDFTSFIFSIFRGWLSVYRSVRYSSVGRHFIKHFNVFNKEQKVVAQPNLRIRLRKAFISFSGDYALL